jgi:hypothetical protein
MMVDNLRRLSGKGNGARTFDQSSGPDFRKLAVTIASYTLTSDTFKVSLSGCLSALYWAGFQLLEREYSFAPIILILLYGDGRVQVAEERQDVLA